MQRPSELLTIAIVDDNVFWCRRTKKYICSMYPNNPPKVEIYINGEEFLEGNGYYDVVFLNTKIGEADGFEIAQIYKQRAERGQIIFLTDQVDLCRRGYLVGAFRFIPKEFMEEEVAEALHAVHQLKQKEEHIMVPVIGRGPTNIAVADIVYAQVDERRLMIHTKSENCYCNISVTKLEKMLKDYFGFFRSHRSCLVNLHEIAKFDRFKIYMKDRSVAFLSTHRSRALRQTLLEYQFKVTEIKGNERNV